MKIGYSERHEFDLGEIRQVIDLVEDQLNEIETSQIFITKTGLQPKQKWEVEIHCRKPLK